MTSDGSLLCQFEKAHERSVTIGDVNFAKIIGKGIVEAPGIPKLKNVLYMEGLKHNFLSISQICDLGYAINFANDCCEIKGTKVLVKGI